MNKKENIPKIRFIGFTDLWEQRKLVEMSTSIQYGLNAAATDFDGINKYIRITDIDDELRFLKKDNLTSPSFNLSLDENFQLKEGDLLFARTGASVGKTYIYKSSDGKVYFAGFLIRARIRTDYSCEFIFQNTLRSSYQKFIKITSQRSGQPGVNAKEYGSLPILTPKMEEQVQIGNSFKKIDNLITLHQREYKI